MIQLDIPQFDIFRVTESGLLWCCSADTFEQAEIKARKLAQTDRCEHVILNQATQTQVTIRLDAPAPKAR